MNKNKKPVRGRLAVIDDDEAACVSISQMLELRGYSVFAFPAAEEALASPRLMGLDCIITDIKMPGMDGEQFLAQMTRRKDVPPIIMITGHGDIPMAVRCLKAGAYDFVEKPFDDEVLLADVERAVEKSRLQREGDNLRLRLDMLLGAETGRFGMIGTSMSMQDVYEQIAIYAKSDAPLLISGETGVGKELVAQALHFESARARGPFIPVNAGALPETTIESELFGHARGAFTGAETQREGKLVTASGGTLLLDEIESISEKAQVQLLRVLEDGLVQPLGRDKPRKVDIRLLLTTKQNLKQLVQEQRMRDDFYHRIAVLSITVPALRERVEDIPLLVAHFLKKATERNGTTPPEVPEKTLAEMMRYPWPGNVRELKNSIERMVVTAHAGIAGPFQSDETDDASRLISLPTTAGRLRDELEKTEKRVIESALRENCGEINSSSQVLGISRRALYERMKKYELHKEEFRK